MAENTYRLSLKSTHEEAARVPDFVTEIQNEASLNEDEASTFMLLLSEAVDNAIQHGNQYDPERTLL
jgi:serine/threonine-protein kinase RsbW